MTDLHGRRLIARWLIGAVVGTALIAVTSPLFVRSYLPATIDPMRGVPVMPAGADYRWRSEGYATTQIGPFGMPGKTTIADPSSGVTRIALWGDSQAEGVSVPDDQKLFAQIERSAAGTLEVFPLAQSGDDASDWIKQIPLIEPELAIDMHVVLIADLPDLLVSDDQPIKSDANQLIANFPAFLIQSARNLVTDSDGGKIRKLRFSVGPVESHTKQFAANLSPVTDADWEKSIGRLGWVSDKPIWIVYAPPSPQIAYGTASFNDGAAATYAVVRQIAEKQGVRAVNVHGALSESARAGQWPHGFQNGQIGHGHLNAIGYALIVQVLLDAIESEN
jgi:hypothetical protein